MAFPHGLALILALQGTPSQDAWYRLELQGKPYGWQRVSIQKTTLMEGTGYLASVSGHCQCVLDGIRVEMEYEFEGLVDEELKAIKHTSCLKRGQEVREIQGTKEGTEYLVESVVNGSPCRVTFPAEEFLSFDPFLLMALKRSRRQGTPFRGFQAFHDELGLLVSYDIEMLRDPPIGFKADCLLSELGKLPLRLRGERARLPRKIFFPSMGLRFLRASESKAKKIQGSLFEISSLLPLERKESQRALEGVVTFIVTRKTGDLSNLFLETSYQSLRWPRKKQRNLIELTVSPPELPPNGTGSDLENYLEPGPYIQSQDPDIAQAALEHGGEGIDSEVVVRLVQWVYHEIRTAGVEGSTRSAKDTLQERQGDCTECACLLAALCRSRNIPCRVCSGLKVLGDVCGLHAWNEVSLGGKWIPVDAAWNLAPIGPTYLLMARERPRDPFLSVLTLIGYQLLGDVTVEVFGDESI